MSLKLRKNIKPNKQTNDKPQHIPDCMMKK